MFEYSKKEANKLIGGRVQYYIKEAGWTYKEVSDAIGMSAGYIQHVVGGKYTPSADTIIKLAVFLDIRIEKLVTGVERWVMPKGLKFNSGQLSAGEIDLYYYKMEEAREEYLKANPDAAIEKAWGGSNRNEGSDSPDHDTKEEKKPRVTLVPITRYTINDNSMDLLGIRKDSGLDTIPSDVDNIIDGRIYRIYIGERIYYRKVVSVGDTLVLIPFSSDDRYTIVKLDKSEVKSIDEVRHVNFTINRNIKDGD